MQKQIRSIVGLALLLAAVSAYAQIEHTIQVKIEFPFVAAGKMFPAADYRIQIIQPTGLVTLTSPGIQSATMLTNKNERQEGGDDKTYLQFQRYGESWVLSQVNYDGTAQVLHLGKAQRELPLSQRSAPTMLISGVGSR